MRSRVLVALTFVTVGIGGPAFAQSADREPGLPDLPGMGVADRATRAEVAPSQGSRHEDTGAHGEGTKTSEGGAEQKAEPPDPSSIRELPGTGGIPTIGDQRVGLAGGRREVDTMPRGLLAAAALGTIFSVGAFLVVRARYLA